MKQLNLKILEGYVENRTKEASLAVVLLALTFIARIFTIQVIPGLVAINLSSFFIYAAATILSWPYTIVFTLATIYRSSNLFVLPAWFVATQTIFFLSKIVGRKWAKYTPIFGEITGFPTYGLILHAVGVMNVKTFFLTCTIPNLLYVPPLVTGALVIWKISRMVGVID